MCRASIHRVVVMAIAATVSSSACGGNASADAAARAGRSDAGRSPLPPLLAKPLPSDACGWFGASDVEATIGPVAGAPTIVRSAERPRPEAEGHACLYRLTQQSSRGTGTIAVEVSVASGVIAENVMGATRGQPSPWDYSARIPMGFMGRQGHVAIIVTAQSLEIPRAKVEALAARVLEQVSDQPYMAPPDTALAKLIAESMYAHHDCRSRSGARAPEGPALSITGPGSARRRVRRELQLLHGQASRVHHRADVGRRPDEVRHGEGRGRHGGARARQW